MSRPICVLGGTGLLGHAVAAELSRRGLTFTAPSRAAIDLTDTAAVASAIDALRPAAVLNLCAFTDVGAAERPENAAVAVALNVSLPAILAKCSARLAIPLVHVSTDYVFDGTKSTPYLEDDPVDPLQVYGATKLDGERAALAADPRVLILRVSTLYGPGRPQRPAYVDAILTQARARARASAGDGGGALDVVELPVSSPTYAPDVAPVLLDLLAAHASGIVHTVNDGGASRLTLAKTAVALAGLGEKVEVRVRPEPPNALRRPAYSVLDTAKVRGLIGRTLPRWEDGLERYVRLLRVEG